MDEFRVLPCSLNTQQLNDLNSNYYEIRSHINNIRDGIMKAQYDLHSYSSEDRLAENNGKLMDIILNNMTDSCWSYLFLN
jgi:hypothetical protein